MLAVPLKRLLNAVGFRRRDVAVELSRPTLDDESVLYEVYRNEVLTPWREGIKRIVSLYTLPVIEPLITRDADGEQLQWLVDQIERQVMARRVYQTERLGVWVTGQGNRSTRQTVRAVAGAVGVDVRPYMVLADIQGPLRVAIGQNVALISRLNGDTAARVQAILLDGFNNRRSKAEIARALRETMGISDRRARLIAKDQIYKLNSEITKIRARQLGVKKYKWRTKRDSRVRKTHRAREGRTYTYAKGPRTGPPGYEINCRCHAEAILPL